MSPENPFIINWHCLLVFFFIIEPQFRECDILFFISHSLRVTPRMVCNLTQHLFPFSAHVRSALNIGKWYFFWTQTVTEWNWKSIEENSPLQLTQDLLRIPSAAGKNCSCRGKFWSWWTAASCDRGESQKVCDRDGRGRRITILPARLRALELCRSWRDGTLQPK